MSLHQYNKKARARIARAVKWTETQTNDRPERARRGVHPVVHKLVRAQADIEHGYVGNVYRLSGPAIDQSLLIMSGEAAFRVYNPGPKVWSGSDCIIAPFGLPDASISNPTTWYIVRAWSATRIRGKTTAIINPGQTGTINTITAIDGTVSFTSTSVYLPTEIKAVTANLLVWAELVYRPISSTSRWEIYSGDCPGD